MPVCCVIGTTLDFGLADVGEIFFFFLRWLRCAKTHALLSSGVFDDDID